MKDADYWLKNLPPVDKSKVTIISTPWSADDLAELIRKHDTEGINRYFIKLFKEELKNRYYGRQ